MEQTIGKRISANRKRLGMTQDQLAEQLGITAQAVSKWENDQSCPDIATLPRLAEIFGISVDELLGRDNPAHVGEVVDKASSQKPEGGWSFQYENPKKASLMLAVLVLAVGGIMLASQIFRLEAGFWDILWPTALLVFGLFGLYPNFSFFRLGCGLLGGYFLLSNLHILSFVPNSGIVISVILLLFGAALLVDSLKKRKKPVFNITYDSTGESHSGKNQFTQNDEKGSFQFSASFGEQSQTVSLPCLSKGIIRTSFGDYTLSLAEVQEIAPDCHIQAECSFGELTILVPRHFQVKPDSSTAFASVTVVGAPDPTAEDLIFLNASCSFGEITIQYI